jgi:hypothetical protein
LPWGSASKARNADFNIADFPAPFGPHNSVLWGWNSISIAACSASEQILIFLNCKFDIGFLAQRA